MQEELFELAIKGVIIAFAPEKILSQIRCICIIYGANQIYTYF